mmetsp:Transcript_50181/g.104707  ORF Transcript_50181/g.104707 Transcript_50181/m.104707 type:complete len:221 (+) Transcript_50181:1699-2361(+)
MKCVVRRVVFPIVVVRELVAQRLAKTKGCFICPAPRHIPYCIPPSPNEQCRQTERPDVLDTAPVAPDRQVECPKSVTSQRVCTAAHNHCSRLILFHNARDERSENALVALVVNAVSQWVVDCIILTSLCANVQHVAGAREVVAILMKRDRHHPICRVEGFLDAITMVNINIDVKNTIMHFQQFQDSENNVIHEAKPACLALFCVVKATGPIDGNISLVEI